MLDKYCGMSQLNAEQGTNYKPWLKQQTWLVANMALVSEKAPGTFFEQALTWGSSWYLSLKDYTYLPLGNEWRKDRTVKSMSGDDSIIRRLQWHGQSMAPEKNALKQLHRQRFVMRSHRRMPWNKTTQIFQTEIWYADTESKWRDRSEHSLTIAVEILTFFSFFLSFLFSPTEHDKVQEKSYLIFGIDKTDAYIRTIIGRRRIASCSHG